MSRIEGVSRPAWPPLRMSYADEPRTPPQEVVEHPAAILNREEELSRALDQRLSGALTQIRASIYSPAPQTGMARLPTGSTPQAAGRRLDILA